MFNAKDNAMKAINAAGRANRKAINWLRKDRKHCFKDYQAAWEQGNRGKHLPKAEPEPEHDFVSIEMKPISEWSDEQLDAYLAS